MRLPSLSIDLRVGERIDLSGCASVELVRKSGQLARLRVTAPPEVKIERVGADPSESVPSMDTLQSG
ncbi:MAG: hypothetical protein ACK50S_00645 [bacterium]|jgi:hypothetical protein